MVAIDEVNGIFADARAMYESSLERLAEGDIRDAAEKAWCATLLATNALLLARTGPEKTPETSGRLDQLARREPGARTLVGRYYSRQQRLHGDCFYSGIMEYPRKLNAASVRPSTTFPTRKPWLWLAMAGNP